MNCEYVLLFISLVYFKECFAHGMMLRPLSRSSLWRNYPIDNLKVITNYNDNQNFCGGFSVQWDKFGGKCGVCGDVFDMPHPQDNENTGLYGKFGPVENYESGSTVNVTIRLTANHLGNFAYSLCNLNDTTKPETGEECFQPLILTDGSIQYNVISTDYEVHNQVTLPEGLVCDRCVLRWHYNAGNNWGWCTATYGAIGCGPQETFRSCSDITIY